MAKLSSSLPADTSVSALTLSSPSHSPDRNSCGAICSAVTWSLNMLSNLECVAASSSSAFRAPSTFDTKNGSRHATTFDRSISCPTDRYRSTVLNLRQHRSHICFTRLSHSLCHPGSFAALSVRAPGRNTWRLTEREHPFFQLLNLLAPSPQSASAPVSRPRRGRAKPYPWRPCTQGKFFGKNSQTD